MSDRFEEFDTEAENIGEQLKKLFHRLSEEV